MRKAEHAHGVPRVGVHKNKNRMTWPQFFDKTRKMVPPFGMTGYPICIVIDGDGIGRWRPSGYGKETDSRLFSSFRDS